jgi:hypothetical protein
VQKLSLTQTQELTEPAVSQERFEHSIHVPVDFCLHKQRSNNEVFALIIYDATFLATRTHLDIVALWITFWQYAALPQQSGQVGPG